MSVDKFEMTMKKLSKLPKVQEHMNKLHVQLAKQIYGRRLEKGLTQANVVKLIRENGGKVTQAQLSRIETANEHINIATYEEVLEVLDFDYANLSFRKASKRINPNNKIISKHRLRKSRRRIVKTDKELIKA